MVRHFQQRVNREHGHVRATAIKLFDSLEIVSSIIFQFQSDFLFYQAFPKFGRTDNGVTTEGVQCDADAMIVLGLGPGAIK